VKTTPLRHTSPQILARVVGLLYLTVICAGIIAQMFISDRIVIWGDAAATAANISTQKALFQLGFTVYLIEMAAQIAQTAVFYTLLRPVSRSVSLVALVFGLVGCTIKTLSRLFFIAPLLLLGEAGYLAVFSGEQQQALALLLLNVNDQAAGMALPFFGLSTLLNGYLVLRSTFLPRFLGVLSIVGGLGWLSFIYPLLGLQLYPYILAAAFLGSAAEILWLLIKGVNADQWHRRAAEAA
jgi:hypothetical protein